MFRSADVYIVFALARIDVRTTSREIRTWRVELRSGIQDPQTCLFLCTRQSRRQRSDARTKCRQSVNGGDDAG